MAECNFKGDRLTDGVRRKKEAELMGRFTEEAERNRRGERIFFVNLL